MRLGPRGLTLDTEDAFVIASLRRALPDLAAQIRMELHAGRAQNEAEIHAQANAIVTALADNLPDVRRLLDTDLRLPLPVIPPRARWTRCCCAIRR
jgi:serine O-acetyltransferase